MAIVRWNPTRELATFPSDILSMQREINRMSDVSIRHRRSEHGTAGNVAVRGKGSPAVTRDTALARIGKVARARSHQPSPISFQQALRLAASSKPRRTRFTTAA